MQLGQSRRSGQTRGRLENDDDRHSQVLGYLDKLMQYHSSPEASPSFAPERDALSGWSCREESETAAFLSFAGEGQSYDVSERAY